MRFFYHLFICFTLSILAPFAYAQIWVITDGAHPVYNQPKHAHVIYLDAAHTLHDELSSNLPSQPEKAAQITKMRLENSGNQLQKKIQIALQGIVDAWVLGITKIPAVIVNHQYVVYGEADVGKALFLIEKY